jgi:hypothetical protein
MAESVQVFSKHFGPWGHADAPQPGQTAYASYAARQPGWPDDMRGFIPAARAVWAEIEGTTFVPHCPRCAAMREA